ncbi:hypothetical protein A2997_02490 [Candidatus Nomurabacteria bacterium RIFCSPLOWO2_01_FULL_36_10b]|uniref:Aspartyl/glutamyl-tRNA(Asn/Gln) amidotransferase subunit C n=1 Tax=Candidatus Nomurabacteria bacterium RIFCSPLOWO2_01_FULL_36_10b TaxID=1801766 RepID=A0A1F6WNE1_9BACT|nr:MAG: hypothetical protein A2997_02490 [Candidatus Nomurabacteria bacterium RIFCSPLOWO2_01_FULL_36_10b]
MITRQDVDNLCVLARIGISDAERDELTSDLEKILEYVEQVKSVTMPAEGDMNISKHISQDENILTKNVTRDDTDAYPFKKYTDVIMNALPDKSDGYARVQRVLGVGE